MLENLQMRDPVPQHVDGHVDILERCQRAGLIADLMLNLIEHAERLRRNSLSKM